MKKIVMYVFCYIFIVFSVVTSFSTQNLLLAEENNNSSAKGMVTIESNSNRIIFSKNENKKLAMASTTKIVTAITVIDNCVDLNQQIIVNDAAIGVEGTSIYLKKGEEIKVIDLLYGLMLSSGNDAATALAYHTAGSIDEFCKLMLQTAQKVGAINSSFVNPHGLDDKNHYTTAYDLAVITGYALNNEIFAEIVKTKNYKIPATNLNGIRHLKNKNKLLTLMDDCIGVKTGFTSKAGRCFVGAAKSDDATYICVVLSCGPMFVESANNLKYAVQNYKNYQILDGHSYVGKVKVDGGDKNEIMCYYENNFIYPLTQDERENILVEYEFYENISAPIQINDIVGKVKVYLFNHLLFSQNICSMESATKISSSDAIFDVFGTC